jgi:hypothetical protein
VTRSFSILIYISIAKYAFSSAREKCRETERGCLSISALPRTLSFTAMILVFHFLTVKIRTADSNIEVSTGSPRQRFPQHCGL